MSAPARFVAERDPAVARRAALAERYPENPFCTPAYAEAARGDAARAILLGIEGPEGALLDGCFAYLSHGRLVRHLEIPSLPRFRDAAVWEAGFGEWCGQQADRVELGSFAVAETALPSIGGRVTRWPRREYVLDLTGDAGSPGALSSNHRRNRKRAEKAGIRLAERADPDAAKTHLRLTAASRARRAERGEPVASGDAALVRRLLAYGAGSCMQALDGEEVLSSILLLRAARGAYYHSAGTSPRGMECGAAVFLVTAATERLRGEGVVLFNLGGAGDEQEGLGRFKAGFGAEVRALEAGRVELGSPARHALARLAATLRRRAPFSAS